MTARRTMVVVAIVLAVAFASDFWHRIYVPSNVKRRGAESLMPANVPPPLPASRIQQDLVSWMPGLRPVVPGTEVAGDAAWTLSLLAVFEDRKAVFAVVRAVPSTGSGAKVRSIVVGDELYGYKVSSIESRRVILTGERGEQRLTLFEPKDSAAVIGTAPLSGTLETSPGPAMKADSVAAAVPGAQGPGTAGRQSPAPAASAKALPAAPATQGGPKVVESKELKPGDKFQLPASMQGMPIVEAPPPPPPKKP